MAEAQIDLSKPWQLFIETVAHDTIHIGDFESEEAAVAKVQEMITVFQELDAQVGDDQKWETWNDVPEDLKPRDRCCFESDLPVLINMISGNTLWWSEDTNKFEDPNTF